MKKLLIFLCFGFALTGCNVDVGNEQRSEWIDTYSGDWTLRSNSAGEMYYEIGFNAPYITSGVCNRGMVSVYLLDQGEQLPLPSTRHYRQGTHLWSQTVDYSYKPGMIYFYVSYSDFVYNENDLTQPGDLSFRVVVSEPV